MATVVGSGSNPKPLAGIDNLGDSREGITTTGNVFNVKFRWDILAFRRNEVGVIMFIGYPEQDGPAMPIGELARLLDQRIQTYQGGSGVVSGAGTGGGTNKVGLLSLPFASALVDLWPEFDKPTMLVIYQFTLSSQVKLPAEIQLRIPASAGVPNAVANCQPDGSCFNAPYDQTRAGEWSELSFQATSTDLRVEYYDPALTKDGTKRHYEYTWPGDHAIDMFNIRVQQPTGSENMYLKPETFSVAPSSDGFTYHSLDVGQVRVGQTVDVVVEYDKATDELSKSNMPVQPSETPGVPV
jgi:hypothetical protein